MVFHERKARDGIRSHRGAPTLVGRLVDSFPLLLKAVPEVIFLRCCLFTYLRLGALWAVALTRFRGEEPEP